jgi:hypothetical protein
MLALRIEASRCERATATSDLGIRSSMLPQWLREPDHETGSDNSQDDSSLPGGDGTEVTEQKLGK